MSTAKEAVGVLVEAERRLRDLVGAAAAAGEYDAVQRIADWARTIGALSRETYSSDFEHSATAETRSRVSGNAAAATYDFSGALRTREPKSASGERRTRRAPPKGEYPKFFRRGDQLVKIGWSKKEREEYQHKAPRRVAETLATAIAGRSARGRPFTAEQVFPLTDPEDGSEIPGYQGYVVLAWFKSAGLVKQNGRSGYSAKKAENLGDAVTAAWVRLPEQAE